jgi:hypothetical protein
MVCTPTDRPSKQRHEHEVGEAAEPDGCERGVAERADHGRVDQVHDVLRHHAADDRQRQQQDALRSRVGPR